MPAREANIDMSAEVVRDVLVRALERSSGERPSSTDTLPETAREETVNRSHDERSSSADTLPETEHEETDDN